MTNLIECSAAAYSCPLLIKHLLETALARAPKQEIVYRSQARLTYRDFRDRVGKLASGLAKLGVRPGQTVAVMDFDSHRYLECFFAVPMMGATLHTINVRLSPEQILYTINHARDDIILVNSEFAPILEQIWDRVEGVKSLVWIDDAGGAPRTTLPFVAEYETLLAGADAHYVFPDFHEDTRATTFYTTGTTGLPKGVYFSHRQLALHTLSLRNAITGTGHGRLNDGDVYMPVTPMFHVHAWGFPYVTTTLGLKQVYPGKYSPDLVLDLIAREKVTFSHCVPTILQMILAHPKSKEGALKGWKVIVGGAALPRALAKEAMQHGIDITTGYGMSETCPVLTLAHLRSEDEAWDLDRQVEVRIKAGRPIPLVDLRVVDPEMRDVPRDGTTPGEIVARAPWLTQGYLRDPANSEKLWLGGWLHTGDIGVIGPDGYLKITDRLKDVIKTGGEWVSSLDIEDLILKQPGVGEAAVIGIPDPKWTERPLAVVVLKQGSSVSDGEIKAALQEYASKGVISRYAVPDQIVFVSALPRTSVGKLDKKLLREQFRDYRAAPSATASSPAMRPSPAEARAQQA
jgi:acyl-CoA synthetase (AMP-forming)/AMP-acid ligase II